ncbi:TMV resistance protein N-like isoform X1 [Punica granatum]|uniref:ADP-ribosyl cyclase/cyclic ADP-ribose hydrolase n=2 Tax=Punica granatum TaxID=22663 RepID=A0A6P8CJF3_PUNGR|nr:TMV resistance protein N-like isoform X1 [Punica granatum]
MASSSSSSSSAARWNFDVFLSFRGEDTREGFTGFLYEALTRYGIVTFMDEQLRKGESISAELIGAIEQSRASIVVFSENYASSGWCLDELAKIMEWREAMGHQVRPLFYRIDPSEVRHQSGKTGEYLRKFEEKFGVDSERIRGWRIALNGLANMSGWHFKQGVESRFIQRIVEEVSSKLNRPTMSVATNPVGIDDLIESISPVLSIGLNEEVLMIGIYGIGGIGKSTIAKAIYNKYADDFEGSSFLANVKDMSGQQGLVQVQETLLFEILGNASLKLFNADQGISVISHRLRYKRVLVVIDDIDHLDQLRKLAGNKEWFGRGSRIIITTRDRHLLDAHGVEHFYEMKELNYLQSYRLFCLNAFREPNPPKMFKELTSRILDYAKNLPLAVIVLGSFLCGRTVKEWESAIARLKSVPNREYNEILKISYDGLDDFDKAIFLDIACFFNAVSLDYVVKILDACKFFPDIGIRVLVDKSLINVENNKLWMHDLLQEMGREVVRKESPNNPGERSRLWFPEDVIDVLTENLGTSKVEAIKLVLPETEEVYLNAKAFKRMKRLRLLIIHNAYVSGDLDYLSNNLRWVEWEAYPFSSLPPNFHPQKLVGLYLYNSRIKHLGEGYKIFKDLRHMSLERSERLTEVPDLSTLPNLESLILMNCSSLVELHDSVGFLDKLVTLNLEFCYHLKKLPRILKLKSLRSLLLTRCRSLEKFPEVLEDMESLQELRLTKTSLKELPQSTASLVGLEVLCVSGCKKLKGLPDGIYKLKRIKQLLLQNCLQLGQFSENDGENCVPLISAEPKFPMLQSLKLRNCNLSNLNFFRNLDCISTLEELQLSRNNFVELPSWIGRLSNLRKLDLSYCSQLKEIPNLPPSIESITATDCELLESFPQLSGMTQCSEKLLPSLKNVDFTNCHKLAENIGNGIANVLMNQEPPFSLTWPGHEIPEWFKYRTRVGFLYFQIPEHVYDKLVGFTLCAVVKEAFALELSFLMNGEVAATCTEHFFPMTSHHLWLLYPGAR